MNLGRIVIGIAALLLSSNEIRAQACNFSMTNLSWGSIDTGLGSNFDLTGTFTPNRVADAVNGTWVALVLPMVEQVPNKL